MPEALVRHCEHCLTDISHKRRDARFCDRNCKMSAWHVANRATDAGKAAERLRNSARYEAESAHRRASATDYYHRNQQLRVEYSREWRRENPHRRREQADRRAERMVTNPGFVPFGRDEWLRLVRRHDHRCAYCGERPVGPLEMDHVIPLSRGGRHAIANILPACRSCNAQKSAYLLIEWRLHSEGR